MKTLFAAALLLAAPAAFAEGKPAVKPAPAKSAAVSKKLEVKVTANGFEPQELRLKKGEPTTITFTRVTDQTCIKAIEIPSEKITNLELPLNQPITVTFTPK